ncbi:sugar ABC transporter ATP-binding protein [Oryzifoliimicrobium ureilyticus]|uniref:sugar ABC transporter ATP-binding protein n=1 Tax=Oryzifoliimicrobium ureilyticus TaxID=3113724 RepID=UPI0030766DB3
MTMQPQVAADHTRSAGSDIPLLKLTDIEKRYGFNHVLKGVNLTLAGGSVHGLLGENGAGKSTLMKVVFGLVQPDSGTIDHARHGIVRISAPRHALSLGIGLVSQELNLVPQLDVAQNMFLGATGALGLVPRSELRQRTARIMSDLAPHIDVTAPVDKLGMADRQLVEIGRTLAKGGEIIAFDEPTSSLTPNERDNLFAVIRGLKAAGKAIIYISHRMDEIRAICDTITILRDGRVILCDQVARHDDQAINEMITGRQLGAVMRQGRYAASAPGSVMLELKSISTRRITDISLSVRAGEILGLAGLVGSGRSATLRAIFGIDPLTSGEIHVGGAKASIASSKDAIGCGIAYIPEDRRGQAIIPMMSVEGNFGLANQPRFSRLGFTTSISRKAAIRAYVKEMGIKPGDISVPLGNLSGGNQQKVVIARWLQTEAKVLLFDEPTRGIDVGAKAEIYALLRDLASKGAAIIVVSSELPEVLLLSDRIATMSKGRVISVETNGEDMTEEHLLEKMAGEKYHVQK